MSQRVLLEKAKYPSWLEEKINESIDFFKKINTDTDIVYKDLFSSFKYERPYRTINSNRETTNKIYIDEPPIKYVGNNITSFFNEDKYLFVNSIRDNDPLAMTYRIFLVPQKLYYMESHRLNEQDIMEVDRLPVHTSYWYMKLVSDKDREFIRDGKKVEFFLLTPVKGISKKFRNIIISTNIDKEEFSGVFLHEFGHMMGLKHCSSTRCVMRADYEIKKENNMYCDKCESKLINLIEFFL